MASSQTGPLCHDFLIICISQAALEPAAESEVHKQRRAKISGAHFPPQKLGHAADRVTQLSYLATLHKHDAQHLVCFCPTGLRTDATNICGIVQGMKIKMA